MKFLLLLIMLFPWFLFSQAKNKIIEDQNSEPMLIGYCTREAFRDSVFASWFNPEYESYEPDSSAIEMLKERLSDARFAKQVEIIIVMGSWCDDSRMHVPHLYKILDLINYPTNEITLIAVNEDKKTEGDEIKDLAIELVPTIIFYLPALPAGRDDSELGRIVEMPGKSLEEDMFLVISR
ncbi:MAG: hypothetical protein A2057_13570 [Ignavibacteria bacterium GWA2_35_9]|nr:MAG: hypothetical protein A2057_13570 [Ignavibacteria bacterium GWA2_35_9]OGV09376.1 MAG: hypothetical protein A2330_00505 [Ignavibacteria bacterium RIFOXYB2_FULL_36_7]